MLESRALGKLREGERVTEQELAEIKARADAATPGPWTIPEGDLNGRALGVGPIAGYDYDALSLQPDDPDLVFAAHARTDVPALLDAVTALRAIAKRVARCPQLSRIDAECPWCDEWHERYAPADPRPSAPHRADCPVILASALLGEEVPHAG